MGRITSRGCARIKRLTLNFVLCDPMFLAQPVDVIRPIRSSHLSNEVFIIYLYQTNNNNKHFHFSDKRNKINYKIDTVLRDVATP